MNRLAGISVDVDSITTHLQGYGIHIAASSSIDQCPVHQQAVSRALDLFAQCNAKATFFFVANDAKQFGVVVRKVADAGHEIGCHSMTHQLPFNLTSTGRIQAELHDAKKLLEDLSGRAVVGFRAPSWDMSDALLESLTAYDYLYDASLYPSWAAYALRMSVRRRAVGLAPRIPLPTLASLVACPDPHVRRNLKGSIVEIPVSTSPLFRFPYYHTLGFVLPKKLFRLVGKTTSARRCAVNYIFHGVDFLELRDRGVPAELSRHPGMLLPLDKKLLCATEQLNTLSTERGLVSLATIAKRVLNLP